MKGLHPRAEHRTKQTGREWEDKILQHALRDLGIEPRIEQVSVGGRELKPSPMAENIHRWAKMHMAEKGI